MPKRIPDIVEVVQRLEENHLAFIELPLQTGTKVIVMERGARILGPFLPTGESLLWLNPVWRNKRSFREFIVNKEWNIGGERIWIAPEMQFCIRDRSHLLESYQLPFAMDPGEYRISTSELGFPTIQTTMMLEAYNLASGSVEISVDRLVHPAPNPLRRLHTYTEVMQQVRYSGYIHEINLHLPSQSKIFCETWDVMQVKQGGTVFLALPETTQQSWYYHPIDPSCTYRQGTLWTIGMERENKYKIGIHSANYGGRVAYLSKTEERGIWSLLVRNHLVDPSGYYTEEPFTSAGENGYALHFYNSGDPALPFGEIECNGQAIGGDSQNTTSRDQMATWFFLGSLESLQEIARTLLPLSKTQLQSFWP
jgi:hypothetical protein